MENSSQSKTIIILSGLLVAALLAAVAVIFLLPSGTTNPPGEAISTSNNFLSRFNFFSTPGQSTPNSAPSTPQFDVTVLDRGSYNQLNTTLINNGLLPVKPDPGAGKANPFL